MSAPRPYVTDPLRSDSTRFITRSNFNIYNTMFWLFPLCGMFKRFTVNCACTPADTNGLLQINAPLGKEVKCLIPLKQ